MLSFTFEFLISPLCLPSPLPPEFTATTTTKTCVLFPPLVSEAISMSVRSGTWQSRTPLVRKDDSRGVRRPFKKPRQAQTHVSVESEASDTETRKARQVRRWGRSYRVTHSRDKATRSSTLVQRGKGDSTTPSWFLNAIPSGSGRCAWQRAWR